MAVKWHLKVGYVSSCSAEMLTIPASSPPGMLASEVIHYLPEGGHLVM